MPRSRVVLIPTRPIALLGGAFLTFDATTRRARRRSGQAVTHPKQSGLDGLTDDVLLDPEVVSMTCHFVDYPLYYGPAQFGFAGRAKVLADEVRDLQAKKILCILLMGDDVLPSMAVVSTSDTRSAETGDAVDIDVELSHVEVGELGLSSALVDAASQALGADEPAIIGIKP